MNKKELATILWAAADKMRGNLTPAEYKNYVLGFLFYKYLSSREIQYCKNLAGIEDINDLDQLTEEDIETITEENGYFIRRQDLFDNLLKEHQGRYQEFLHSVDDALAEFKKKVSEYGGNEVIFGDLFTDINTQKLGASEKSRGKAVYELFDLLKEVPTTSDKYDVLGYIYEYMIAHFANKSGDNAGEFYTPHEVSALIAGIVANHFKDKKDSIKIYDPTSGSGSLLLTIGEAESQYINPENIYYYAQELNTSTYNLTRMNLVMRGINPKSIHVRNADTLADDWPKDDAMGSPMRVDAVVSNPPYSASWDPNNIPQTDKVKYEYGIAPQNTADYAFLEHDLYHVNQNGLMVIVLPHGVLFRGNAEATIRKNLIERNKIDTIISLPDNMFYGTSIPTIIMILKQQRDPDDTGIFIVDASHYYEKDGTKNRLRASDIKRILDTVNEKKEIKHFSRHIPLEEIRANDYNLNIPRYVTSKEKTENYDIYSLINGTIPNQELTVFDSYWNTFPGLKEKLFTSDITTDDQYSTMLVKTSEIKETVEKHVSVQDFYKKYTKVFNHLRKYINNEILHDDTRQTLSELDKNKYIFTKFNNISNYICTQVEDMPIIDHYDIYQIFNDVWAQIIEPDLEIILNEGLQAAHNITTTTTTKNKKQYSGYLLPFSLVQNNFFKDDFKQINNISTRLMEINDLYTDHEEAIEEENQSLDFLKKDGNGFKSIKKSTINTVEEPLKTILREVFNAQTEEKDLKKKKQEIENTIEQKAIQQFKELTDQQINDLLLDKWINPLIDKLNQVAQTVITDFISALEKITTKYADTIIDIDNQIDNSNKELANMLALLQGDQFDINGLNRLSKMLGVEQ